MCNGQQKKCRKEHSQNFGIEIHVEKAPQAYLSPNFLGAYMHLALSKLNHSSIYLSK